MKRLNKSYLVKIGSILVYLQRPDDSWLGSPVCAGKSYGTGSAVSTLLNVQEGLRRAHEARSRKQAEQELGARVGEDFAPEQSERGEVRERSEQGAGD